MKLFKSSTLASPSLRKRKRKIFFIKIALVVALIAALGGGIIALSRLSSLTIRDISAKGNSVIPTEDISAAASTALEGNYLLVFPKRNFLLYPKKQVVAAIEAAFPTFKTVQVDMTTLHSLEVIVTERMPSALWCTYDASASDPFTSSCYLMDASGFVYLKAPEFKGSLYVRYYGALEDGSPVGQTFLPGDYAKLGQFIEGIKTQNLTPVDLFVQKGGDYDLKLQGGGDIIWNKANQAPSTLQILATVLSDNAKAAGDHGSKIDYIDLRYGNKVYFKFK